MPRHNSPPSAPLPTHATKEDAAAAIKSIAALERISRLVTRSLMSIGAGALIFTCVNVTLFAITHHTVWEIAWMLDPMVSVALITILYVDGVLVEITIPDESDDKKKKRKKWWAFALRWFTGIATWLMNCWQSLYPSGHFTPMPHHADPAGLLLHSVAPGLVILMSEASAEYRDHITKTITKLRATIHAADETARLERDRELERAREERDRAERERLEQARLDAERQRRREEQEHEARLERERREAEIELESRRQRAALQAREEERDREAARRAQMRRAEAEAKAIEERARAEAREREAAARARRKASQRTVNSGPSTLTVNPAPSTVNSSTVNPARVTGNTEPTVNTGRESYRQPDNTATVRTGNVPDETWVEVGHPVYEAVRDAVGKRPPEGAFRSALAERVAELVRAGKLPEVALNPSLSTAKRVRGLIERRFPDVSPIHPVADEEAC